MTIQPAGFVSEALKPKNRTHGARGGQGKFAVALFGGGDERGGITFTFYDTATNRQCVRGRHRDHCRVMSQPPAGEGTQAAPPSLIHHNKSIARGQKMNVSMEGAA